MQLTNATAVFMGLDGPRDDVSNVDVEVITSDGSRWSATFLTLEDVARIMGRWSESGECLGGRFFSLYGTDIVITSQGGLDFYVALLDDLIESGEYRHELQQLDEE